MKILPVSLWLKALSGLCQNLSAGWFGVVLIAPNFSEKPDWPWRLTINLFLGILLLVFSVIFDKFHQDHEQH